MTIQGALWLLGTFVGTGVVAGWLPRRWSWLAAVAGCAANIWAVAWWFGLLRQPVAEGAWGFFLGLSLVWLPFVCAPPWLAWCLVWIAKPESQSDTADADDEDKPDAGWLRRQQGRH